MKKSDVQQLIKDTVLAALDIDNIDHPAISGVWQTGEHQYHIGIEYNNAEEGQPEDIQEAFVCVKISACNHVPRSDGSVFDINEAIENYEFEKQQKEKKKKKGN